VADPPALAAALHTAENELARYRALLALVAAWIHNPAYDHATRAALAHHLGLPAPTPERTGHG
jgi:multisubunit Na+/H+ antiporter MnhG subunit